MIGSMYKQTTGRHHKEMEVASNRGQMWTQYAWNLQTIFLRDDIDEFLKLFYFWVFFFLVY